jgi:hypothetical protein
LAIEKARYEESVEALRKREEDFMKAAKEQGDKIALAFGSQNKEVIKMREKGDIEAAEKRAMIAGKTSNEYLNFMSKVEEQRAMIAKSTNLVIEEETEIHGKNIKTIDKQWNEERIKSLKEAMDKRYAVFDEKLKKEDLLERERVAKAYIENIKSLSGLDDVTQKLKVFEFDVKFNDESFTFEKTRLQKELKELNEEFAIKLISNVGEDELQKELTKIQALKTALIELEADRTKAKAEEAEKRIEIEKDEAERTLGYVGDVLGMISDLSDVTKERDFKNIDDRKEKEEEKLAKLEESLQGANAKEKVEIEKQIKFQKSKIKEVDDERRKVEEEAAIRTRFIRMAQLISTTALAVMSEYAKTGLVGAIMAGAAGAIQLGIMAAQPFAEGGLVDGVLSGELVGSSGAYMNISELSNGDNVLATLRKGEVVLNEEQQKKLGGDKVFKALGVKGFANGGRVGDNAVVGYSSGGADIAGLYMLEKSINNEKDKDIKNLMNEFKNGVFDMVSNINNRIDNIEVLFVIDDYEREVEDRDGAKKRVSLK